MNLKIFVVIILFSGGMFNSDIDDTDAKQSSIINFQLTELFYSKYEIDTYLSVCNNLMYEDGSFYSENDVYECKESVTEHYEQKMDDFDKPDFEFFTVKDTGYRAKYSDNIYKIDVFGIYCNGNSLTVFLIDSKECDTQDIGSLYMTKNSISDEWGYAGKGFETTNGKYLKVIRP